MPWLYKYHTLYQTLSHEYYIIHGIISNSIPRQSNCLNSRRYLEWKKKSKGLQYVLLPVLSARNCTLHRHHNALFISSTAIVQNPVSLQYHWPSILIQIHSLYQFTYEAPFLEKYTNFSYGKRKTWIVISQFSCFTVLIIASLYT